MADNRNRDHTTSVNHNLMTSADNYTAEKEIGKGSFATVYRGHLTSDKSQHIAIKEVSRAKLKNKKLLENLEIEIAILKKIKHPHIVGLIDCERTSTDFYLIMEYCALGDLTFLLKRRKELMENHPLLRTVFEKYPPPSESHNGLHRAFVLNYLQQLASALKFLRSKNLVHRDIKPQNLLLSTPLIGYHDSKTFHELGFVGIYNLPILKIADFGFARFLPNTSLAETLCGSPLYMAPEILNYQKYNAKADLWSVGTVVFEMCCGTPPFRASNHLELFKKIKRANDVITFPSYCNIEKELKELICSLLTFDPAKRIGFEEFFNNKIVNEDLSSYELEDDLPDLESKSKGIVESNMFVSEYLSKGLRRANSHLETNQSTTNNPELSEALKNSDILTTSVPKADRMQNIERKDPNNRYHNNLISDRSFEREYVVVEKKSVEVNSLADEVAQAGFNPNPMKHPTPTQNQNVLLNQQFSPNNQQYLQSQGETPRLLRAASSSSGGSDGSRRPSLVDRRLSISSLNPSNALSRALGIASTRLFGGNNQQQQQQQVNSSPPYNQTLLNSQLFHDLTDNIILRIDNLQHPGMLKLDNNNIVAILESLAAKAFVVYSYAEVKFSQIVPLSTTLKGMINLENRHSMDSNAIVEEQDSDDVEEEDETLKKYREDCLSTRTFGKGRTLSATSQLSATFNKLPLSEMVLLCNEAIVLYMKALSILSKSMQVTSNWWYESQEKTCSLRVNVLVQWLREKFNECLEKADFLRLKINDLRFKNAAEGDENENLEEKGGVEEPVYLEKLLYDRALEISKMAAHMELKGENLYSCELAYATSLWMLETSLDDEDFTNTYGDYAFKTSIRSKSYDGEDKEKYHSVLDENDRLIIRKYIDSIANRLKILRQKMNHQN
ncbi:atg1p [Saccharomyces arboricola H-6]|uniref:Serine/threonine-protein kinase ATG1 n=1 Tax=Saccharomyces arboricola (strain H-6 / AS 2.3317 / CBS 10644) TaxID=1160507 RepID=J8Q895_SACAR|nr:atg1p [Saccharomyces arboricola H-6]